MHLQGLPLVARVQRRFSSRRAISKPLGKGDRRCCCSLHRDVPQPRRTKRLWRHLQLMRRDAPKDLLFFTGPFGVRHLSSRRHRICQPSLKHFSMYLLSVRTSIAPVTLSSASHTAVSSIRFCVVSMALPTSCSVLPSRSINAAQPPRPATPSALQLPSVHTSVFMGRSIQSLAPSRLGVVPALVHRRPRLRANGPLAWRSVCAAPAPCAERPPPRWRSQARRR